MESVTITDETVIAYGAFENCTMLTDITYDDKNIKKVSDNAFTNSPAEVTAILPVNYTNANGTTADFSDAEQNGEVVVTADLEGMEDVSVYVVMYDENGLLVAIRVWDVSTDTFNQTVSLPQGKNIAEIKTFVVNDELSPLLKAYGLN